MDDSFMEQDVQNPQKCNLCSYTTRRTFNLNRHVEMKHTLTNVTVVKQDKFICENCGKGFKSKYGLTLHQNSFHKLQFRFKCDICNRGFNSLWNFKGHMVSHNPVCKDVCDICGSRFQYRSSLLNHKKTCNQESMPVLKCKICAQEFLSKDSLREHSYAQHENRVLGCKHCGKPYKWRSSRAHHEKVCGLKH